MGSFIAYNFVDQLQQQGLRIETNGTVSLRVTEPDGRVHSQQGFRCDAQKASALITDAIAAMRWVSPQPDGQAVLTIRDHIGAMHVARFCPHDPPRCLQPILERLRALSVPSVTTPESWKRFDAAADRFLQEHGISTEGGPRAIEFAMWVVAFFVGHFVAAVIGLAGLMIAVKSGGLLGMLVGFLVLIGAVGSSYFFIGREIGLRFPESGIRMAWIAALLAIAIPAIVAMFFGDVSFALPALVFPAVARFGAQRVTYRTLLQAT